MYATLGLALVFVSCCAGETCNKICDYNDEECILKGANVQYKSAVEGINGELPSIDPMVINKLDDDTELSNIQFTGLRGCYVTVLRLDPSVESYDYRIYCPAVVSEFNYLNQRIKATSYNNDLYYIGNYGYFIKGEYQKKHFYIKHRNSTRMDYKEFKSVQTPVDDEEPAVIPEETIKSIVSLIANKAMDILMDYDEAYLSMYCVAEVFPDC